MSNYVTITPTMFQEIELDGSPSGEGTWGLKVSDDNESTFCDTFDREQIVGATMEQIVELARGIDSVSADIISFAEDMGNAIYVGDHVYKSSVDLDAIP